MSVTIQLHPAIQHYFKEFNNFTIKPSGILTQNMDRLVFEETVKMTGSYIVCAEKVKLSATTHIHVNGPGGGLIAGSSVLLKAPEFSLIGTEDHPIKIVALDSMHLEAEDLRVKNLSIYLFGNASFSICFSKTAHVKNIRLFALSLNKDSLVQREIGGWKNTKSFIQFIDEHPEFGVQKDPED